MTAAECIFKTTAHTKQIIRTVTFTLTPVLSINDIIYDWTKQSISCAISGQSKNKWQPVRAAVITDT